MGRAVPHFVASTLILLFAVPGWSETASVRYVSEAAIYLDVGAVAGIQKGAEVRVVRDGNVVAVLAVEYVAAHSASCRIVSGGDVRVGDRVDFEAVGGSPNQEQPQDGRSSARRAVPGSVWSHLGQMQGRVATFYVRASEEDGTYQNPAVSGLLRWVGTGQEDLSIRIRGDRPSFDYADDQAVLVRDAREVRLFEASVHYRSTAAQLALEGGRFLPTELEGIGPLDGASVTWRPSRTVRLGATGGRSVPNGVRGFASHDGHAYGGFIGMYRVGNQKRWSALVSWTSLHDPDLTRREFAVVRSDATIGVIRFYQRAEVDVNPQWKRDIGENPVELTAWSLGHELRLQRRTSLTLSIDSRRPVLLPEVRDSIENLQLERQYAMRGAFRYGLGRFQIVRIGARYGWREASAATTRSWDVGLNSSRLFRDGLSATARIDSHRSGTTSNAHVSANLRQQVSARVGLAAAAGAGRQESGAAFIDVVRTEKNFAWVRLGADLRTSSGLWFDVSNEWQGRARGNELALGVGQVF